MKNQGRRFQRQIPEEIPAQKGLQGSQLTCIAITATIRNETNDDKCDNINAIYEKGKEDAEDFIKETMYHWRSKSCDNQFQVTTCHSLLILDVLDFIFHSSIHRWDYRTRTNGRCKRMGDLS